MQGRLFYEDSCRALQSEGLLENGKFPPLPKRSPNYDDEKPLGVSFFRMLANNVSLEQLTLPRTFVSRSEFKNTSMRNTDLSESTVNWNDFRFVDFTSADLSRADLRACIFESCEFTAAKLCGSDLRHCTFINCNFSGADLSEAKLTEGETKRIELSERLLIGRIAMASYLTEAKSINLD